MSNTLRPPASVVDDAFRMTSVTPTGVAGERPQGEDDWLVTLPLLMAEINRLKERVYNLERRVLPDRSDEYPPIFDSMSASGP